MFIYMSVCLYLYIYCKCIVISIPYLKKKELLIIVCAGIIINKLKSCLLCASVHYLLQKNANIVFQ